MIHCSRFKLRNEWYDYDALHLEWQVTNIMWLQIFGRYLQIIYAAEPANFLLLH